MYRHAIQALTCAALASQALAHDGRRFEIKVIDGKLYARGYDSAGFDDGAGVVRPYFNAMHDHFSNLVSGGATADLPGFDLFEPGPLVGHRLTLELTGASKWDSPPMMPMAGTVPTLAPLESGEIIFASIDGAFVSTDAPGTLLLESSVAPTGFADGDVNYDTAMQPAGVLYVLTFTLATDAPGIAPSDPISVVLSPDGSTMMERLHHASLYLEGYLGLTLCTPDLNGDGVLDNGDIAAFVSAFFASDLAADFNADGVLDNGDITSFVSAFLAGC
ncbi:MAG: GC-type dockerin domain-anchored protein [Phycisphaerales bacterium JB040]